MEEKDKGKISRRGFLIKTGEVAAVAAASAVLPPAVGRPEQPIKTEAPEIARTRLESAAAFHDYRKSQVEVARWLGDQISGFERGSLSAVERTAELLNPGDIAPETWGGAGLLDVMAVSVVDPEFTGQVVIGLRPGATMAENVAYTVVDGRDAKGQIVKGANWKFGLDANFSRSELNISLGGNGGGQLFYDKEAKELIFWLNGFPIGSPENPTRRITFHTQVKVNPDQSRVLHQPMPLEQIQYYMRAGAEATGESGTQFAMVAHASLREPPLEPLAENQPLSWMPLLPTVVVGSGSERFLYVVQTNSQIPGTFTSFVWPGEGDADLAAETALVIAYDPSETSRASFPVPDKIVTMLKDTQPIEIDADIEPTDDFAFTAVIPDPTSEDGEREQVIALPTLSATADGQEALMMTQTAAVYRSFLPVIMKNF